MKKVFQAADGKLFDTQVECERYEQYMLYQFVAQNCHMEYSDDAGFYVIGVQDVVDFIKSHHNKISEILGKAISNIPFGGWIINTQTTCGHPPELKEYDLIEVLHTSGYTEKNKASKWLAFWDTNNVNHIVKYRKVNK